MIKGIGVDMVDINQIRQYMKQFGKPFIERTFTPYEVQAMKHAPVPEEYLATRFAAKEAVFKAVAQLTEDKSFDFRIVETRNDPYGAPKVHVCPQLQVLLDQAHINTLHISITTESNFTTAFVVASQE